MSTALMATMPIPFRPNAMVLRYMCCHRNSMSQGFCPSSNGFRYRSIVCFVTCGASAAFPIPTRPLSVKISTTSHPWKVNVPMDSCRKLQQVHRIRTKMRRQRRCSATPPEHARANLFDLHRAPRVTNLRSTSSGAILGIVARMTMNAAHVKRAGQSEYHTVANAMVQ